MKVVNYCVVCNSKNVIKLPGVISPFITARIFGWEPTLMQNNEGFQFTTYPICGTVRCQACGYIGGDVRFDDEEMGKLYTGYRDEEYTALREKYEPGYRKLNGELEMNPCHTSRSWKPGYNAACRVDRAGCWIGAAAMA
jgi:hypothetical protein